MATIKVVSFKHSRIPAGQLNIETFDGEIVSIDDQVYVMKSWDGENIDTLSACPGDSCDNYRWSYATTRSCAGDGGISEVHEFQHDGFRSSVIMMWISSLWSNTGGLNWIENPATLLRELGINH